MSRTACWAMAIALLAGCGADRGALANLAPADAGARAPGPPPLCQPGIRDTACVRPDGADAPVAYDAPADRRSEDAAPDPAPATDGAPASDGPPASDGAASGVSTACTPVAGGTGSFRLTSMSPAELHLDGGHVELTFSGNAAEWTGGLELNDRIIPVVERTSDLTFGINVPPSEAPGPIRLVALARGPARPEIAWLDCAGRYVLRPALPTGGLSDSAFSAPLHPELARPCARAGWAFVTNQGDVPMVVSGVTIEGAPGYSLKSSACAGQSVSHGEGCGLAVCFTSTTPGPQTAVMHISTNGDSLDVPLAVTVHPWTSGLDPTFGPAGAEAVGPSLRSITVDGDQLVGWSDDGLTVISPDGKLSAHAPPLSMYPSFVVVRAAAPGQGIYALVVDYYRPTQATLLHFLDDGTWDLAFGGMGAVTIEDFSSSSPYKGVGLQVQPSGRVLVTAPSKGVRAFTAKGEADSTYLPYEGAVDASAIDPEGRLYVAGSDSGSGFIARLQVDGRVDASFGYRGSVQTMVVDGDGILLVSTGAMFLRLDQAGVASPLPVAPQPELADPILQVAVDARGRILVLTSKGALLRYRADGTLEDRPGFAGTVRQVVCPRAGGCTVLGSADRDDYVLRLLP